CARKEETFDYW
nr:immunoglobulin heavy chain junction region [Macaca mulatta]MOV37858.1 immunoglobulin heavy chain junction region [Macaca mulatta]MOV37952.1 immunoglobulin heavy chain junction region [Macaca mulatta]MOV38021.1 immunoglobulin heavy chain junction region [Macaca mulatta]MOV38065.1 immunoglobulin heavy chain junction region [Macaca mulatta]